VTFVDISAMRGDLHDILHSC